VYPPRALCLGASEAGEPKSSLVVAMNVASPIRPSMVRMGRLGQQPPRAGDPRDRGPGQRRPPLREACGSMRLTPHSLLGTKIDIVG
jgi:hypothetical protein